MFVNFIQQPYNNRIHINAQRRFGWKILCWILGRESKKKQAREQQKVCILSIVIEIYNFGMDLNTLHAE